MKINFGAIAFIVGLVLAVFIALLGTAIGGWATWALAALGLVVGLLNVTGKEAGRFLLAAIAFIMTFTSLGTIFAIVPFVQGFFNQMVVFMAPATAVVAISSLFTIVKN